MRTSDRPGGRRRRVVLAVEAGALAGGLGQVLRDHGRRWFCLPDVGLVRRGRARLRATVPGASVLRLGATARPIRAVAAVVGTQGFGR